MAKDKHLITGTDDDDVINGDQHDTIKADHIKGLAGDDLIHGLTDDDVLEGGPGDDEVHGDTGDDTIKGGPGDDVMYGGAGNDNLTGGPGDDIIYGGPSSEETTTGSGPLASVVASNSSTCTGSAGGDGHAASWGGVILTARFASDPDFPPSYTSDKVSFTQDLAPVPPPPSPPNDYYTSTAAWSAAPGGAGGNGVGVAGHRTHMNPTYDSRYPEIDHEGGDPGTTEALRITLPIPVLSATVTVQRFYTSEPEGSPEWLEWAIFSTPLDLFPIFGPIPLPASSEPFAAGAAGQQTFTLEFPFPFVFFQMIDVRARPYGSGASLASPPADSSDFIVHEVTWCTEPPGGGSLNSNDEMTGLPGADSFIPAFGPGTTTVHDFTLPKGNQEGDVLNLSEVFKNVDEGDRATALNLNISGKDILITANPSDASEMHHIILEGATNDFNALGDTPAEVLEALLDGGHLVVT